MYATAHYSRMRGERRARLRDRNQITVAARRDDDPDDGEERRGQQAYEPPKQAGLERRESAIDSRLERRETLFQCTHARFQRIHARLQRTDARFQCPNAKVDRRKTFRQFSAQLREPLAHAGIEAPEVQLVVLS